MMIIKTLNTKKHRQAPSIIQHRDLDNFSIYMKMFVCDNQNMHHVGSGVLTAVVMENSAFWDMTQLKIKVPPKSRLTFNSLQGVISQKIEFLIHMLIYLLMTAQHEMA
jgi:hypothetical protein